MSRTYAVSLNEAEAQALRQIRKHGGTLNGFERDLLGQVVKKVDRATRPSWNRFVWSAEEITFLRRGQGSESPVLGTPDEHTVQFVNYDELMNDIDRITREEGGAT